MLWARRRLFLPTLLRLLKLEDRLGGEGAVFAKFFGSVFVEVAPLAAVATSGFGLGRLGGGGARLFLQEGLLLILAV